ncbi:hypothetical protein T265_00712 [Opisthorchis viverrini]|uniref:Uncharacterized protein n=1 Tax=Opisthorchis viverrini TaxID=6198 RepID=A0A075A203_OPIVI|nr:hypothetical protein T265_00712 [Opisthorchis viverrini]KER33396.1 hypothetical protein T265_00712 [Opisthorchis viverrini]
MSPPMVTKRLQTNCQARRTDQQPPDQLPTNTPELPIFQHITNIYTCCKPNRETEVWMAAADRSNKSSASVIQDGSFCHFDHTHAHKEEACG